MRGAAGRATATVPQAQQCCNLASFRDNSLTNRCLWVMRALKSPALAMHIGRSRNLCPPVSCPRRSPSPGAGNLRAQDGTGSLAKPTTNIVAAAVAIEVEGETHAVSHHLV